ncbi:hypothetical protein V501_10163 [Pseudogymnoascus sp. VKM F-4519 (FW-2642)]|nr:hypothetical protein V501_10163 [Pseudogymnoascus sp. VKM F-4519 (FW-2642)]
MCTDPGIDFLKLTASLELCLGAHAAGEGGVADDVAEGLSVARELSAESNHPSILLSFDRGEEKEWAWSVPLRLVLGEDLALGVVADDLDVDEAAEVELLGAEHGHDGGGGGDEDDGEGGGVVVVVVVEVKVGAPVFFGDQRAAPSVRASPSIFIGQCAAGVYDTLRFPHEY